MQNQENKMGQHTSTSIPTQTIHSPYDYAAALESVTAVGKELYGADFRIVEEDRSAVLKLLCWFMKDDSTAAHEGLDLQRGLLLSGPVGCGKTALLKIMRRLCDPARSFLTRPCAQVSLEFGNEGFDVIARYTTRSFCIYTKQPRAVCFDDLGFESDMSHFGVTYNVMAQILGLRYELFMEWGMLTHLTTNLNGESIESRYGKRIRSRMRQMFNHITFSQADRDKRR